MRWICLSCLCWLAASAAEPPKPLLALDFEHSAANAGTLGGEAKLVEYAPGQGPHYGPGLDGQALWLDRAPRAGGPGDDKVGGAVTYASPALASLSRFTLTGWFRTATIGEVTRLFYRNGAWDLFVSGGGGVSLAVVSGGQKRSTPLEPARPAWPEGWLFFAVAFDGEAGTARTWRGQSWPAGLALAGEAKGLGRPDSSPAPLELGNLDGLRPFKGVIDRVRVYDAPLDDAQVEALYREGLAAMTTLRDGLAALPPLRGKGPNLSDVCFSTRYQKPEGLAMMKAFGATRCEWVYGDKPEFVAQVHAAGASYAATINANPPMPGGVGAARDFDGQPIIAPWMRAWKAVWATSTYPKTRETLLAWARKGLDTGADSLQVDDPVLEAGTVPWGGDFEPTTVQGFGPWLKANVPAAQLTEWGIVPDGFDYHAWLREKHGITDNASYLAKLRTLPTTGVWAAYLRSTVRAHYTELRQLLDTYRGRRTPMSMNTDPRPDSDALFLADFCDYFLGETPFGEFARDGLRAATARSLGLGYVASPLPRSLAETRFKLAGFYALGALPLVPWDLYMGSDATSVAPRYYGKVEEYGDLFAFVRRYPELFDGWENAPVVGVLAPLEHNRQADLLRVVGRLLDAQVPFTLVPTGGRELHLALVPERLRHLQTLVRVNPEADFTDSERVVLADLPVLTADGLTRERLDELAPVVLHGPRGVYALPRVPTGAAKALVVHVVNTTLGPDSTLRPQRSLSLTVRAAALLGGKLARATWYEPGAEPKPLECDEGVEGPRVLLPTVREWGVLRLELGGA